MCGRFTLRKQQRDLQQHLGPLHELPLIEPRYNIAPSQPVLVVRHTARGRQGALVRWGLVPHWSKDPAAGSQPINARSETAAAKPTFRDAMKYRRCLIPADGFYEWQRRGRSKQPYLITLGDDALFAFAGLWDHWQDAAGNELETCAILTCAPNALMQPIHNRMPVIMPPEHYAAWLDPANKPEAVSALLSPYAADAMRAVPVSTHVNNPKHDDEQCITPAPDSLFG